MTVRVRIAPAPSGSLHIGNVRTALYNWLFARKNKGVFMVRVEDTDPSRVVEEHYETIQEDLRWMGLEWDEGPGVEGPYAPYFQSKRVDVYAEYAQRLVDAGAAYRCYCTADELKERREAARAAGKTPKYDRRCYRLTDAERSANDAEGKPWALRLFIPEGTTSFEDIITGDVTFHHEDLDDVIIVRSDGRPLYNLAVSVDDGIMKMTHVIRGLDLQSSTPYQIIMHNVFGHEIPRYAHIPLVTGPRGQKLAKRFGGDQLETFRARGYLPETMINYLALLGWGTADQTILSRVELVAKFELEKVHASPAMIDPDKLDWMNGEYIRMLHDGQLAERITPWLVDAGLVADPPSAEEWAAIEIAAPVVKTRVKRLEEVPDLIRAWFSEVEPNQDDFERVMREPWVPKLLDKAESVLSSLPDWNKDAIEAALRELVDGLGLKLRAASRPLYVAITGRAASAPLFDTMEVIGRDKSLERIKRTRNLLHHT